VAVKFQKIGWDSIFKFDLDFGPGFDDDTKGEIKFPTYGNHGGPQQFNPAAPPIDKLDALFAGHDLKLAPFINPEDGSIDPSNLVQPHAALFNSIFGLAEAPNGQLIVDDFAQNPKGDAEATLYASLTIYGLTAQLVQSDLIEEFEAALDPRDPLVFDDVPKALEQAEECAKKGNPSGKELKGYLDMFDDAFDQFLDKGHKLTSTAGWDDIA